MGAAESEVAQARREPQEKHCRGAGDAGRGGGETDVGLTHC